MNDNAKKIQKIIKLRNTQKIIYQQSKIMNGNSFVD